MAYSLVQAKAAEGTSATASVSCTATGAGNLLILFVGTANNPGNNTFTAPVGWSQAKTTQDDNDYIGISTACFYKLNCAAGITSAASSINAVPSQWDALLLEFSGVGATSTLDASNALVSVPANITTDTISATTTTDGDLLVGLVNVDAVHSGATTVTDPSGWTAAVSHADGSGWLLLNAGYETQTTHGSVSFTPTWNQQGDVTLFLLAFTPGAAPTHTLTTLGRAHFPIRTALQSETRSMFAIRTAQVGRGQAQFSVRTPLEVEGRSRFTTRTGLSTPVRAVFALRSLLRVQGRTRFAVRTSLEAETRSKFSIRSSLRGAGRSRFSIRSPLSFQGRSRFSVRTGLESRARSTFKILAGATHALAALGRGTFVIRAGLQTQARDTYSIRTRLASAARARYSMRTVLAVTARVVFPIRVVLATSARVRFLVAMVLSTTGRGQFILRRVLKTIGRAVFFINQLVQPAQAVTLSARFQTTQQLTAGFTATTNTLTASPSTVNTLTISTSTR